MDMSLEKRQAKAGPVRQRWLEMGRNVLMTSLRVLGWPTSTDALIPMPRGSDLKDLLLQVR